jgi:hypothetical protein
LADYKEDTRSYDVGWEKGIIVEVQKKKEKGRTEK